MSINPDRSHRRMLTVDMRENNRVLPLEENRLRVQHFRFAVQSGFIDAWTGFCVRFLGLCSDDSVRSLHIRHRSHLDPTTGGVQPAKHNLPLCQVRRIHTRISAFCCQNKGIISLQGKFDRYCVRPRLQREPVNGTEFVSLRSTPKCFRFH